MSLHYTPGRLRILVEDMTSRDPVTLTLAMWKEVVKLVRLGALNSSDTEISLRLIFLVLNKSRKENATIKAIGFRIFLVILLNINHVKREYIKERLRQVTFSMLRATVENSESPDSITVRTLADAILFKLFRQIMPASSSFDVLLDAYGVRKPDQLADADYPKYFRWIVDRAEEDEINREQISSFLTLLERRWTVKRDYNRRCYEVLLKDMQYRFRHNLLQEESKCFSRLLQQASTMDDCPEDAIPEKDENDPVSWINYNNWTIPRYWIAKQQKKEGPPKRQTFSTGSTVQFVVRNTHNSEAAPSAPVAPSSITSSYCSDCLDKQRQELQQHLTPSNTKTSGNGQEDEAKLPASDTIDYLLKVEKMLYHQQPVGWTTTVESEKTASERRQLIASAGILRSDNRNRSNEANPPSTEGSEARRGVHFRSTTGQRCTSALPGKGARRSLG